MKRIRRRILKTMAVLSLIYFAIGLGNAIAHRGDITWSQFSYFWHLSPPIPATDANRKAFPAFPRQDNALFGFHWGQCIVIDSQRLGRAGYPFPQLVLFRRMFGLSYALVPFCDDPTRT